MIRAVLAGLGIAVAALFVLLFVSVPGYSAGLHPRCNLDWPCAVISKPAASARGPGITKREARRVARGQRLEQAMPFGAPIYRPETQRSFLSGTPRYISGRLKCAVNVGAALAARGIRGTGSALAKSYLHWGRPSGPQPGAVAAFSRGRRGGISIRRRVGRLGRLGRRIDPYPATRNAIGHVAIVDSVLPDGTVIYGFSIRNNVVCCPTNTARSSDSTYYVGTVYASGKH